MRVAAGLSVAACQPGFPTIAPVGLQPTDHATVAGWIGELSLTHSRLYEIRPWRFRNERGPASGRAAVRMSPPDSLRFDYRGPFGRSGNAVLVGDSVLWMSNDDFQGLVTFAELFWTSLGLPPVPPDTVQIYALADRNIRAWRYILAGDTLNFRLEGSPASLLLAEVRRRGEPLGF